ncbi:MAG TPA: VWA domain-containing protein, partial [Burkholderiaceae bacterium]|nr:VWA domain-containing protein [Burkholderiaceae bacterium]
RALHRFFRGLKTPYRFYEAENAEALQRAIADLGRLESGPLELHVLRPRRDLRAWPLALALTAIAALFCANLWTIRPWQHSR